MRPMALHGAKRGMGWGQLLSGWGCLSPKSGSALLGRKGRGESGLFPASEWEECSQLYPETSPYVWSQLSSTSSITPSLPPQLPGGSAVTGKGAEEAFEHRDVVINTQDKVSDLYTQLEKLGE
ncbi:hypothetical protein IHE44_0010175 [Lamprotornis superbus]|uniref:Uncharacterized protein n=1 Tax=Lamprotornis superbus TaxID=245042 RepID=A0A835TQC8_9PASS|nr:hypothetical protein IHE44_0010175 [Lamprotornis superbus]